METKAKNSFGQVILEVGKHIHNRQVITEAVVMKGSGSLFHVWELDDGETIMIQRDLNAPKSVVKHATVLIKGESSWKSWKAQLKPFDEVISALQSNGFITKSVHRTPTYVGQLPLLQQPA